MVVISEKHCALSAKLTPVSAANKGSGDLKNHIANGEHRAAVQGMTSFRLTNFFAQSGKSEGATHAAGVLLHSHCQASSELQANVLDKCFSKIFSCVGGCPLLGFSKNAHPDWEVLMSEDVFWLDLELMSYFNLVYTPWFKNKSSALKVDF